MDATKKPIKISPELVNYAEKHKIFEMMKNLLELLIIEKPNHPIKYLIEYLQKDIGEIARIFVLGPPVSGKLTIGKMLAGRLQSVLLTSREVFAQTDTDLKAIAEDCLSNNRDIPADVWTKALRLRTKMYDCEKKGFVLVGYPETREQVYSLQCAGIFPSHVVFLTAPDQMLIERSDGKRIDPETGDVYHLQFDPAPDAEVKDRLQTPALGYSSRDEVAARLARFKREAALVRPLYETAGSLHIVSADQPIADVFQTALESCIRTPRLMAPLRTPRVLLLGPPGAGCSTLAQLLADKYGLMRVHCGDLIRQSIADNNRHGLAMRSYVERKLPVPDSILIQLIEEKLTDLCCSTYGWVLVGYPRNAKQAEELDCIKLQPNRVFFLELPAVVSMERMCEQRLDPVTGAHYHQSHRPATDPVVAGRLITEPRNSAAVVKRHLAAYAATETEIRAHYRPLQPVSLDASRDLPTVLELLESHLVNPLPLDIDNFECSTFNSK